MTLYYTQASAGSGKTTSIEKTVADKLVLGYLKPSEIMAVTFTKAAAAELKGRISQELLQRNKPLLAISIMNSRIGTVHSVFGQLLIDFAFELGLSPVQRVLEENDKYQILSEALDNSIDPNLMKQINALAINLSIEDWRNDVLKIVELMRSNNFTHEQLDNFAKDSISSLIGLLPAINNTITEETFRSTIATAIIDAKILLKPTKGLTEAIKDCEKILQQPTLKWQNWVKVSKLSPTKMGESAFFPAIEMGAEVLSCSDFRKNIADFITHIMMAAKLVMQEFAAIKQSRGLIDFIDQEQLALLALDHPSIQQRIKEDIKYLIVDEFQDTNPIQLALFSKISMLVEDVLMVGDAKQAIYGFRGSDPKLALNVLNYVQQGGGQINTLPYSYRSRSELVDLSNELFTKSFSHLLTAEQVQLTSKRTDDLASAELGWWTLECMGRKNNDKILSALAEGIREHINSGIEVFDKSSNKIRKATWFDLVVLCRGNDEAAQLAACCANIGIPVSLERAGLIETPEVSLALACLRRIVDPSDSLASAEIITLATGNSPENWLSSRLTSVENKTSHEWNDSAHPVLINLAKSRTHISVLSTKEALDLAMLVADVASIVTQWKEGAKLTEHRLANLAKLVELVDSYENHCESQFLAATPAGFILWLKHIEQDYADKQASNPGDGIKITTYHSSKGLEWPIVICHSLDTPLKVSLYGARIKESATKFDWNTPLKGRSICYWPNPFPDQRGNEKLSDVFRQSDEWAAAEIQAKNEAIQLLYVGITRARDQIILTTNKDDTVGDWLKLLDSSLFPPSSNKLKLQSGINLTVETKKIVSSEEITHLPNSRVRHWLASKETVTTIDNIVFNRPASSEKQISGLTCNVVHDFGSRININGNIEMDKLGTVLHHCLALVLKKPDINRNIIENLITLQLPGKIQVEQLISRCNELIAWIEQRYPEAILHTEIPFTQRLNDGSLRQGSIDLLLETLEGWVVIDHKSNPQSSNNWKEIAMQYGSQLIAYNDALKHLSDKQVIGMYVHFTISGGLVEIILP
jgi:ATP-dependent helicase/nuclease subunit A